MNKICNTICQVKSTIYQDELKIICQPLKRHVVNSTFYYIILYYSSSTTFSIKIVYQPLKRHVVNSTFYYFILYYSSSTTFSIKLPFFIRTESPEKWLEYNGFLKKINWIEIFRICINQIR